MSGGALKHGIVRDNLGDLLRAYFRRHGGGRAIAAVGCQILPDAVRRPDLSVFPGSRIDGVDLNQTQAPFVPDIAIEVLLPGEKSLTLINR